MPIAGAIFDCDGTLIDSMSMWNRIMPELLERYHVPNAKELNEKYESMNMDEECFFLHDHFGIGESGQALLDELSAIVDYEYTHHVTAFTGALDFVKSLHEAGIPIVVASSTATPQVKLALKAHGFLDYVQDVISTAEVAHGKDHPDIYFAAQKALGTSLNETWVFEDAPFGLKTAHTAGFKTVCLYNDHDGRDRAELMPYADIFVHGYAELSLPLIEDFCSESPLDTDGPLFTALVVDGSPYPSSLSLVQKLAQQADYVVAVDKGVEPLYAIGHAPDVFCGDSDSASLVAATWAHDCARRDIQFPSKKYATDLALALDCVEHEAARRHARVQLVVSCATGGRPDHALAVMGLLASHAALNPTLVEDAFSCKILSPEGCASWELIAAPNTLFSAIPLAPHTVLSERGMCWELDHEELRLLSDVGISNVIQENASITCHEGVAAAFLMAEPTVK